MLSEILIAALVLVLGAYWFRYNCRSILKTQFARDRAQQVAAANHLGFAEIYSRLAKDGVPRAELEALHECLMRDYTVLTALLRYTAFVPATPYSIEQRVLMIDFRLMQFWFAMTHRYFAGMARRALYERARILCHFANTMGERTAAILRA